MLVILACTHTSLAHKYLLLFLIKFITNLSQINLFKSEYNWLGKSILKNIVLINLEIVIT